MYYTRMRVWHAVVLLGLIMAFVRPLWLKRGLLFALIFLTITGCGRNPDRIVSHPSEFRRVAFSHQ